MNSGRLIESTGSNRHANEKTITCVSSLFRTACFIFCCRKLSNEVQSQKELNSSTKGASVLGSHHLMSFDEDLYAKHFPPGIFIPTNNATFDPSQLELS